MKYCLVSKILDFLSILIRGLPEFCIEAFARGMAYVWFFVIRFRVEIILKNLEIAYAQTKSKKEIQELAIQNLKHYVLFVLEVLMYRTLSVSNFQSRFEFHSQDVLKVKQALDAGENVLILTAHLGNFEWLAAWTPLVGVNLAMVIRPLKSTVWEKMISEQRTRTGVKLVSPTGSGREIFRLLGEHVAIAIIFDQLKRPPQGYFVPFFGKLAGTMKSLAVLTEKKEAKVFPVYSERTSFGRMKVHMEDAIFYKRVGTKEENRYAYTKECNLKIEEMIRKVPEQWFWIHDRWLDSPEG
ncbi:MAG: hypothetical protein A3B70_07035 [Deltaproteobacteria bacterium RIFCSPHIGHO2_02_FULL_40_11]|nr:MAG: hypothetical protein A3B70_07035 [Deltaproteobacteria bacterium RIFCSPHIGHO2_02_FULL_40_11]